MIAESSRPAGGPFGARVRTPVLAPANMVFSPNRCGTYKPSPKKKTDPTDMSAPDTRLATDICGRTRAASRRPGLDRRRLSFQPDGQVGRPRGLGEWPHTRGLLRGSGSRPRGAGHRNRLGWAPPATGTGGGAGAVSFVGYARGTRRWSHTTMWVTPSQPGCGGSLRWFGHQRVAVLDGGIQAWEAGGHAFVARPPAERSRQLRRGMPGAMPVTRCRRRRGGGERRTDPAGRPGREPLCGTHRTAGCARRPCAGRRQCAVSGQPRH